MSMTKTPLSCAAAKTTFEVTSENTCSLKSAGDPAGTLTVPPSVVYENTAYTVTAIGNSAFADCRRLVALLIPTTVKAIGREMARGCSALKIVELGDGLTELGDEAFVGCSSLEKVVLSDGLATVPRRAFYGDSSLREIHLGKATASVGTQAFDGCTAITSVVCMAPAPPATAAYAFDPTALSEATLTVPEGCRAAYAAKPVWGDFRTIIENNYGGATVPFHLCLPSGYVTSEEALGSSFSFKIEVPKGWAVSSLTLNGKDVTSELSVTHYFTVGPLTEETTLAVAIRDISGVPEIGEAKVTPRRVPGGIELRGAVAGEQAVIYSLDGIILFNGEVREFIPIDHQRPVVLVTMNQKFIL